MSVSSEHGRCLSEDSDDSPIAVISGATGIVGRPLVQQLARDLPHHRIVLLTRSPECVPLRNATSVSADLRYPDMGVNNNVRSCIQARATVLVHCAADTRFNLPIEQARLTNTEGTRNMLSLACECPRLVQFAHVSTLYVAGRRQGLVTEEGLRHEDGYVNTYEQAKHEAEDLVLSQCGRLPVGIYRLSSVIDEMGKGGCLRQVIRFLPSLGRLPYFPADRRVPVDLISSDWAARALSVLIARHFSPGCIRHVCAGESGSLPVGAITDSVFSAYEKSVNSSVRWPKLIALSDFESLYARLPRNHGIGRALAGLMTFIPHLSISQPFDSTTTRELLAGSGLPQPDSNSLLSRALATEFHYAEAG